METIEVKNGAVQLAISGTYTPEELRQLLRKLCEAHADAAQERGAQGLPRFVEGSTSVIVDGAMVNRVAVLFQTTTFGWVGVVLPRLGAMELAARSMGVVAIQMAGEEAAGTTGGTGPELRRPKH